MNQNDGKHESTDAATAIATTTIRSRKIQSSPAKAKTAFMCFVERMKSSHHGKNDDEVIHVLAERWKGLPPHERATWDEKAREEKLRYSQEKIDYANSGNWKPKTRRARKDPNAPKRPMSAFLMFSKDHRNKVRQSNPTLDNTDISRMLGLIWRKNPSQKYIDMERQARAKYKEAKATWDLENAKKQSAEVEANRYVEHDASDDTNDNVPKQVVIEPVASIERNDERTKSNDVPQQVVIEPVSLDSDSTTYRRTSKDNLDSESIYMHRSHHHNMDQAIPLYRNHNQHMPELEPIQAHHHQHLHHGLGQPSSKSHMRHRHHHHDYSYHHHPPPPPPSYRYYQHASRRSDIHPPGEYSGEHNHRYPLANVASHYNQASAGNQDEERRNFAYHATNSRVKTEKPEMMPPNNNHGSEHTKEWSNDVNYSW